MILHDKILGVNYLFTKNKTATSHDFYDNDTGAESNYLTNVMNYGFKSFRYPGGSITENVAFEDPMAFFNNNSVVSLAEAIKVAKDKNLKINLVIPSFVFVARPETIDPFINKLKTYDLTNVDTIELGNEYWGEIGPNLMTLTEAQYGAYVNDIIVRVDNVRKAKCPNANIFIQSAPSWKQNSYTKTIHDKITVANLKRIDGDVDHWYPRKLNSINNDSFFRKETTNTANPLVGLLQTPKRTLDAKKAQGKTWLYAVSEFNVNLASEGVSMFGLNQGFMLSKMVHKMTNYGISYANFWGFYYKVLNGKIVGVRYNGVSYDLASGLIFKEVLKLSGWDAINTPNFIGACYLHSTYKKGAIHTSFFKTMGDDIIIPENCTITKLVKYTGEDDTSTNWVDESVAGPDQQATALTIANPSSIRKLEKWTYYKMTYKFN